MTSAEFTGRELELLVEACTSDLGSPDKWITPGGYPGSIALCIVDAVFSINARYKGVTNVINRYRNLREKEHAAPDADGVTELLKTFEGVGGAKGWAELVRNRGRTSTRNGILKAEAVLHEAQILDACGIRTIADFHKAVLDERLGDIERAWRTVKGQGPGTSWGYVPILARPQAECGAPPEVIQRYARAVIGVKPDRMIKRYVAKAITVDEGSVSNTKAGNLVKAAASKMTCDVFNLDHVIWRYQSKRPYLKG